MDLALRPRSATEIVDVAVRLFRRHLAAFVTLAAVAAVPRLAIALTQIGMVRGLTPATAAANPFAMFTGTYALLLIAAVLVTAAFEGAFISLADEALRTETASAGQALARGVARAVPVVATFVIVAVISFVGLLFFVAPGIYLGVRLYPAVPAAVLEGVGPGEALSRAWRRTGGSVGRGFVVYLILFVIFFVATIAATTVGGLLGGLVGAAGGSGTAALGALAVAAIVQVLVGILLYPLLSAATTVFYYDTRVRSEGLDVEVMADALGGPAGAGY